MVLAYIHFPRLMGLYKSNNLLFQKEPNKCERKLLMFSGVADPPPRVSSEHLHRKAIVLNHFQNCMVFRFRVYRYLKEKSSSHPFQSGTSVDESIRTFWWSWSYAPSMPT